MKKFLFLAVLAISINSYAQNANNKIQFTKGQKIEHVTQVDNVINIEMMGQSMETKVSSTITRMFDVENVVNGQATIEHKVKRLQIIAESPMGGEKFDSEKEEDMKSEGGKGAEKALKNKYTYVLDATGRVISVKPDDNNPNKDTTKNAADAAMSEMGVGTDLPKAGDKSEFVIFPMNIKKGDTWNDSTKMGKAVYTLSDITDGEYIINFTETGKVERKQDNNGMELLITLNNKTTGKMIVDRKTGILKESTSSTDSEGTMEIMGQSAPMTAKTTKKITLKNL